MEDLFLPVLSHFENGNFWTSSAGRMRYRLDPEEDRLKAQVWEGPWCLELSRVEEQVDFPMSEEGLSAIADWAARWRDTINARPAQTLSETIAARDALRAEKAKEESPV